MCIGLSLREIALQTIEYKPDEKDEGMTEVDEEDEEERVHASPEEAIPSEEGPRVGEVP